MSREQLVNNATTILNGAISSPSSTTITVLDGSVFPTTGDFRVIVGTELMLVTARSTNDLTVVRGIEGTSAATHTDGSTIRAIVTAGGLRKVFDEATAGGSYRYPPRILDATGNVLTSSDFTWRNQGTASVTDDTDGSITINYVSNAGSHNWRILEQVAPTAPWKITAGILAGPGFGSTTLHGMCVGDNTTGELITVNWRIPIDVTVHKWNSVSSWNSNALTRNSGIHHRLYCQIEDDNTNLYFRMSADGINFATLYQEARTTFLTPDRVGFGVNPQTSTASGHMTLFSWVEE